MNLYEFSMRNSLFCLYQNDAKKTPNRKDNELTPINCSENIS